MPSNDDWLDTGEAKAGLPVVVEVPPVYADRVALVEACWGRLSLPQKTFLTALRENRFNARAANRAVNGANYTNTSHTKWMQSSDYATVARVWRATAADGALNKDRLLVRQDDIVETLMTPKPILHQGAPTGFEEVEAGAASRANEVLMKAAGMLKDKEIDVNVGLVGPTLVIQVVKPEGGVIDITPRGVSLALPEPETEWVDGA